jgi:hypothetical protein
MMNVDDKIEELEAELKKLEPLADQERHAMIYEVKQGMDRIIHNHGVKPEYVILYQDYGITVIYGMMVIISPNIRDGAIKFAYNPAISGRQIRRKEG